MDSPSGPRRVLAIIGCQVLEDEIVHVLTKDPELKAVAVVETPCAIELAHKMAGTGMKAEVVSMEAARSSISEEGLTAIVVLNPIGLHQSPPQLREEVLMQAHQLSSFCDSILIFYGLCGNAFRGLDRAAGEFDKPLVILRDAKGLVVDDCIGAVLGGTEEYRQFILQDDGGYTLNTMWASHWRDFMYETQLLHDPEHPEEAKIIFESMAYKKVVMLRTGLGDERAFEEQAHEFEAIFGLGHDEVRCRLDLVESSYMAAKERM